MANPFAITAASNTILLDSQRQGQTTFTVTNLLGRPLRGRARLVTQQPDAAPWLSIIGEAERDLPIAGTQQYGVQVTVPASGPAGSYSFRLDMIGVENPDELFTEGPTVSFSVPEPEVKKPWPSWLPYAVIGGVVVLILVVIVVIVATRPPPATIHASGTLNIPQTFLADLDQGVIGDEVGADIWFQGVTATTRYVTPWSGVLIAKMGTSPVGKSGCAAAALSSARIDINNLPVGTYVCVRTNQGRYSQFRVDAAVGPSPGTLVIGFTTWD